MSLPESAHRWAHRPEKYQIGQVLVIRSDPAWFVGEIVEFPDDQEMVKVHVYGFGGASQSVEPEKMRWRPRYTGTETDRNGNAREMDSFPATKASHPRGFKPATQLIHTDTIAEFDKIDSILTKQGYLRASILSELSRNPKIMWTKPSTTSRN